jgi:hypothetical protein
MGANFNGALASGGNQGSNTGPTMPFDPALMDNFGNPTPNPNSMSVNQGFNQLANKPTQSNSYQMSAGAQNNSFQAQNTGTAGAETAMQPTMNTGVAQPTMNTGVAQPTTNAGAAGPYDTFLNNLYQTVLKRAPDAAGLEYWKNALNSGATPQDIIKSFQSSPEYQANLAMASVAPQPYGVTGSNPFANSADPYINAAEQNAVGNLSGAITATAANRVNQNTPYANLEYVQTGTDANGNPIWSANQNLNPKLKEALDSLMGNVTSSASKRIDRSASPSIGINPGELYSDAIMRRLQPQLQQQQASVETRLANQGIMPGSEAYNRAKTELAQRQNDLLTSAQVGGIDVGLRANAQDFGQQITESNLPIAQLGAFNQGTQPGYVNPYNQVPTAGPDYFGAYTTSRADEIARENAASAKRANLLNGLFGMGSSAILGGNANSVFNLGNSAYNTLFGNSGINNPFVSSSDYMSNIGAYSSGAFDPAMSSADYLNNLYGLDIF